MADRFPLVVDSTNSNIKELPSGDNLDLTGSGLVLGGTAVTATGAELNLLDGVSGLVQDDLTKLAAVNSSAAELNKLASAGTLAQAGKQTIWIPAAAMYPTTTNPCSDLEQVETTAQQPEFKVLDFSHTATEYAQFTVAFPKSWAHAGDITFQVFWIGIASTDEVAWCLQGKSVADGIESIAAFGTAVTVVDTSQNDATETLISAESGDVTITGAADDTLTYFQIYRDHDHGDDDMAGDARLLGIKLFFTTDAANDAQE